MNNGKSYIPFKLFLAYAVLAALITGVTILLFSKNAAFSDTEKKIAAENSKILKINAFLSKVHETESLSRITIQSGEQEDYEIFTAQSDSLANEIASLKAMVNSTYQQKLLDSVRNLLLMKKSNIDQLREIKNKAGNEARVTQAINELTRMEQSLRKLELEDFVRDPDQLEAYQRSVLNKYVEYLNQNIPDDETNTLSQKVLDSMLVASRTLLNEVRQETAKRNRLLNREEKKLLDNELSISAQLQQILAAIEADTVATTTRSNQEKAETLNEIIRIITSAAVVGLALALFFSLLILNDFLKTKKYKKELEFANERANKLLKNREQLISTVSHDLKTPLSTISGYTELLANADLTSKQQYYNTNIKGASAYISRLVQDLLDFTQIEAGKIVVENLPFSLPDVIDEVAKSIQSVHLHKDIELKINVSPIFSQRLIGDAFRLRQILTNLIGNAFKFTSDGQITISAHPSADHRSVIISIEDSGIGIAEDKLQLIFEEFTQADETVEKRFGGTGLGLTISKRMAEILGGQLSVTSSSGNGSTFTLELPLILDPNSQEYLDPVNFTVAIVDDDPNLLTLTTEALKAKNYKTLTFLSAREALTKLEKTPVDMILTDIQMPDMNGFELLEQLQQKQWFRDSNRRIIAITGRTDANEEDYKEAGFSAVVRKPYTPKLLHETILRVVNNHPNERIAIESPPDDGSPIKRLQQFFPNDATALQSVLKIFVRDANANLQLLEQAIANKEAEKVKQVAHKMAPMFRQLGADMIGKLLMELELNDFSDQELSERFQELRPIVVSALADIEKELIIEPI